MNILPRAAPRNTPAEFFTAEDVIHDLHQPLRSLLPLAQLPSLTSSRSAAAAEGSKWPETPRTRPRGTSNSPASAPGIGTCHSLTDKIAKTCTYLPSFLPSFLPSRPPSERLCTCTDDTRTRHRSPLLSSLRRPRSLSSPPSVFLPRRCSDVQLQVFRSFLSLPLLSLSPFLPSFCRGLREDRSRKEGSDRPSERASE